MAATRELGRNDAFVWRHGRADVALEWDRDAWKVTYGAIGRLLGPRQMLHEMRHRRADLAAWDVMARVIHASRDEDLGIRVACEAARWMKEQGHPDLMDA